MRMLWHANDGCFFWLSVLMMVIEVVKMTGHSHSDSILGASSVLVQLLFTRNNRALTAIYSRPAKPCTNHV
jgi:hypothetical protein